MPKLKRATPGKVYEIDVLLSGFVMFMLHCAKYSVTYFPYVKSVAHDKPTEKIVSRFSIL